MMVALTVSNTHNAIKMVRAPRLALLKLLVTQEDEWIDGGAPDWRSQLTAQLSAQFEATVRIDAHDLAIWHPRLVNLLATPVESMGQIHFPTLQRGHRVEGVWQIQFALSNLARG